jgi:adenylate cyclase
MAVEIERKFLVNREIWKPEDDGVLYRQGYLSNIIERVVRVRIAGKEAFLTIKGRSNKFSRLEFEYPIPSADAEIQLDCLCERPLIKKTRYEQKVGDHVWVIDVFHGDNEGLLVAESNCPSRMKTSCARLGLEKRCPTTRAISIPICRKHHLKAGERQRSQL